MTRSYTSPPYSPEIVLAAALKLCDPRLKRFRVLSPIYNPALYRAYTILPKLGLKGESIFDQSLYERLHEEETHFIDDFGYDNFDI